MKRALPANAARSLVRRPESSPNCGAHLPRPESAWTPRCSSMTSSRIRCASAPAASSRSAEAPLTSVQSPSVGSSGSSGPSLCVEVSAERKPVGGAVPLSKGGRALLPIASDGDQSLGLELTYELLPARPFEEPFDLGLARSNARPNVGWKDRDRKTPIGFDLAGPPLRELRGDGRGGAPIEVHRREREERVCNLERKKCLRLNVRRCA